MKIVYLPSHTHSMNTTHISWYTKCIATLIGITIATTSFWSAINLLFPLPLSLQGGSFPISFWWGGNEFPWSLIISSQTSVNYNILFDGEPALNCKRQIHGYYYNAARGNGLLPLSNVWTTSIDGVNVSGWLFTACGNGSLLYDLVGVIHYTYNGWDMGSVYFGVETDVNSNSSNGNYQPWAIQWRITNGINGRFFDTMFGIGTITSAPLIGPWDIGSVGNLIGTFTNIYIQWQAGIGQSVDTSEREILAVNLAGTKTLLTSNDEVIASRAINVANQNTNKNCSQYLQPNDLTPPTLASLRTICVDMSSSTDPTLVIDSSNFDTIKNKDVIVKGGNVFIDNEIYTRTNSSNYLSIYIPDGYLVFDSEISSSDLSTIDRNGFKTTNTGTTQWVYLEGNFIVNGLILWSPDETLSAITTIPFKTYLHWKLISLNTMTTVSIPRERHLSSLLVQRMPAYSELATQANPYFPDNRWNASLWSVFSWQCDDSVEGEGAGAAPQGTFTPATVTAVTSINCPIGHRFPLIITEKNIPSSFFN